MRKKYDWNKIQNFYDLGNTWREIINNYGASNSAIHKAVCRGDLKVRNKSEAIQLRNKNFGTKKHSDVTKKKFQNLE
jgi:predicted DNA-binding protein YlxM (UPF0122 family)